ncbi:hypothetical protein DDB_G0291336 [Dictyostelium discoideum AX4]|uniref:EF-hand domain-containing protein n=1 Tax=Dictyostelium discoideum TaxID=44689 RepID=Q54EU2_DICDI|nr:hypothetical protein DDB_G0291336 [Dictyostelium discoideum AX4]EAL61652.1 hypothetical protein DDB_G0291336 [Dictyostelium discoideum AX4]|eukprot:XP_635148.1 hypothetical protein DDB_G0291336 [Dictyostelium discoideum AX4]
MTDQTTTTTNNLSEEDRELKAIEYCEDANKLIKQLKDREDKNILDETASNLSQTNIDENKNSINNDDNTDDDDDFNEIEIIEKVTELFSKAIEMDSECIDAYLGLAYVKGMQRNYESVSELLEKANKIDPSDERVNIMKQTLEQESLTQDEVDSVPDFEPVMDIGVPNLNIPFIIINGGVTKKFITVLREIFDRFDRNKDNCLNKAEMKLYSKAVNGQELDLQSLQSMLDGYDSHPRNGLTFTGFVELYVNQTIEDSSETLKDLKTLGYDSELKLIK